MIKHFLIGLVLLFLAIPIFPQAYFLDEDFDNGIPGTWTGTTIICAGHGSAFWVWHRTVNGWRGNGMGKARPLLGYPRGLDYPPEPVRSGLSRSSRSGAPAKGSQRPSPRPSHTKMSAQRGSLV